jgi:hypothetical protein
MARPISWSVQAPRPLDDGVEIVRQQPLIEIGRHNRRQRCAGEVAMIGAQSLDQRLLDLGIAPASDSGLDIGRDVWSGGDEGRCRELQAAAGQCPLGDGLAVGSPGCVAVAAGHDRVDEITAALGGWFRPRAIKSRK